jgi:DNA-binding NtrC family response regulator
METKEGQEAPKVLVVEDDDLLRQAIARFLTLKGFAVFEAADGSAALEAVRSRPDALDVMVLDALLPGGPPDHSVLQAAQALAPALKVIVMTGHDQRSAEQALRQDRIPYFLQKPFGMAELVNLIRKAALGRESRKLINRPGGNGVGITV